MKLRLSMALREMLSGATTDIIPVGLLMSKLYRHAFGLDPHPLLHTLWYEELMKLVMAWHNGADCEVVLKLNEKHYVAVIYHLERVDVSGTRFIEDLWALLEREDL